MTDFVRAWRVVLLAVLPSFGWGAPSGQELLKALRDGDSAAIRHFIGAPLDATDEFGSSVLMYAALYADVKNVRLLLDKGADPNHADNAGATALMWAMHDPAKVRLLIERGANVNAVSLIGRTPLFIAVGRPRSAGVVRVLLDKAADPNAVDKLGFTPLLAAAASGDPDNLKLLLDRGINPNLKTSFFLTPLGFSLFIDNRRSAELLLARGADPSKSPVLFAEMDLALFRGLTGKGADSRVRTPFGPDVMTAVASRDTSDLEVARALLKLGLDPTVRAKNLHTEHGYGVDPENALDWAWRHGDTPIARLLAASVKEPARPVAQTPEGQLNAESPRSAIEKALPLLYEGGREFFKRSGCTSCHHNMLPAIAFSLARAKGIRVDDEKVRRNSQQSVAWLKGNQQTLLQGVPFPGVDTTSAYLLWSFAVDKYPRDRATDAAVHQLAEVQTLEGRWRTVPGRPPIESSHVTSTAIAIRALRAYPIPHRGAEFHSRVRRAAKWLASFAPRTGEERAMRVLGMAWAESEPRALQVAVEELIAKQRADGGWAQLDTLTSDAYATGQALYALDVAGRLPKEALHKGIRFLLNTQLADGSWHVRSRSYPVQDNYFDTGFPHGRDQWISAAGTSWACIGLSLAVTP